MFHSPHGKTDNDRFEVVEFERHALQTAIEVARAEGFEGTEAALREMLQALEDCPDYPDFSSDCETVTAPVSGTETRTLAIQANPLRRIWFSHVWSATGTKPMKLGMRRIWSKMPARAQSRVRATIRELPFTLLLVIAVAMYVLLVRGYPS